MAGGMGRRDIGERRETLAERVANTRARQPGYGTDDVQSSRPTSSTPPTPALVPSAPPPLIKHCWYHSSDYGRMPALLLKWRSIDGRYDGLICTVAPDTDGFALVEMWVDASLLAPV